VILTALGSLDGFRGTEAAIGGFFDNVDNLLASAVLPNDSLTGRNADAAFVLDGTPQYLSVNLLDFSGFDDLFGGSADDTFELQANYTGNLTGGAGNDLFVFFDGVVLTGALDGGIGSDTLDLSRHTAARTVTLTLAAAAGFSGTEPLSVTGGFSGVDVLLGTGADTLNGLNSAVLWTFDTAQTCTVGGFTLTFAGFVQLNGGSGVDVFAFQPGGLFAGSIHGGSGTDRLDYSAYGASADVNLAAATATGLTGNFASVEALTGSSADDTLHGTNGDDVFNMTAAGAGNVNGTFTFASVENLDAGPGADRLDYSAYPSAVTVDLAVPSASGLTSFLNFEQVRGSSAASGDTVCGTAGDDLFQMTGATALTASGLDFTSFERIDGLTGLDTIDYSGYLPAPVTVNLETSASTGLLSFAGVEAFLGTGGLDTVIGPNAGAQFGITAPDVTVVTGITFTSFENLTGGSGADTFAFSGAAMLTGQLNGGAGVDLLDFSAYASGVTVDLLNTRSSLLYGGLTGGVTGIENLTGSAFDDTLIGDNLPNVITGNGGDDVLTGNGGNDTFVFADNWGSNDLVNEGAGGGADVMTFAAASVSLTFTLNTANILVTDGLGNLVTHTGNFVETLIGGPAADTFLVQSPASAFLQGGAGNDRFAFSGSGTLTGSLDGQTGVDVFDCSASASACLLTLTGADAEGYALTSALVIGGAMHIEQVIGNGAGSVLTGRNLAAEYRFAAGGITYTSAGYVLMVSGFETLAGGTAADTFTFEDGVTFGGKLNGGAGNDSLDLSLYTTALTASLSGISSPTGLAGIVTDSLSNLVADFAGIETLRSGSASDTLVGADLIAVWEIYPASLTYTVGSHTLSAFGFEDLLGGAQADTFHINTGAVWPGVMDGQTGADTLSFSGWNTGVTPVLSAPGAVDGFDGGVAAAVGAFRNIDRLIGGSASDTLTGADLNADWILDGNDRYVVGAAVLNFTSFETLQGGALTDTFTLSGARAGVLNGGAGDDDFIFQNGASLTGSVNGGSGSDGLNYTAWTTPVNTALSAVTPDGFSGAQTGISGGFTGIDRLSANPAVANGFTGMNAPSVFGFSSITGVTYTSGGMTLSMSGYRNLSGNADRDVFAFTDTGTFNGTLNGAGGRDAFDYSAYNSPVTVILSTTATGLTGSFSNIEDIIGSLYADVLTGDSLANVITGNGGNDTLNGMGGDDVYLFADDFGQDTVIENAAGGSDTLDFSAVTHALRAEFGPASFTAGYGVNQVTHTGGQIESLIGGAGDDVFAVLANGVFAGTLDGSAGADTLDYSAYHASVNADLSTGTATAIRGGAAASLVNIENLTGSVYADTLTGDGGNNVLTGNAGADLLTGGDGGDTYVFGDGWGVTDTVVELSGGGDDTMTFAGVTVVVSIVVDPVTSTVTVTDGVNTAVHVGLQVEHFIAGAATPSTLDFTASTTDRHVQVVNVGSQHGYLLRESGITFDNVDLVLGSPLPDDSLTGMDDASRWTVDGLNSEYQNLSVASVLIFRGFELLQGGASADEFTVVGLQSVDLNGGDGDDLFVFPEGASLVGAVDGQGGVNTVSFAGSLSGRTVTLTGTDATSGFAGVFESTNFTNIDFLVGGNGYDTLLGLNQPALFCLDGSDTYEIGGNWIGFSLFEWLRGGTASDRFEISGSHTYDLEGGDGADTFVLLDSASLTTILTGVVAGAGVDSLDYSDWTTSVTVDLLTAQASGINGFAAGSFTSIENAIGGSGNDFLYGDDGDNVLTGNGGDDILAGRGGDDTYVFADAWGSDTVTDTAGNDTLDFTAVTAAVNLFVDLGTRLVTGGGSQVQFDGVDVIRGGAGADRFDIPGAQDYDLYGGPGADTFYFLADGRLLGLIDGQAGSDTLDYSLDPSSLLTVRQFVLSGRDATGFAGSEINTITGGFAGVDIIYGGLGTDSLQGLNEDALFLIHNNSVDYIVGGMTLHVNRVENLIGGEQNDTFRFDDGAILGADPSGNVYPNSYSSIDGNTGFDTLDYTAYTTPVFVDLVNGLATGVLNGVASIEQVLGGQAGSILYGDDDPNVLIGTAGNDQIYGRGGDDLLSGMGGNDLLDGGSGSDTVAYLYDPAGVSVNLTTGLATDGWGNTDTLISLENILGSPYADTLTGDAGPNVIEGGAGSDTLNGMGGSDRYVFRDNWGADTLTDPSGDDILDLTAVTVDLTFTIDAAFINVSGAGGSISNPGNTIETLLAGSGNDRFIFNDLARLGNALDGGPGADMIDYSNYTSARSVVLTALGANSGYDGSENPTIPGGFRNIEELIGGSGNDTLTGLSLPSHWTVAPTRIYSLDGSGRNLTFTSFETLVGGADNDIFTLASGTQSAVIRAGGGDDTLVIPDGGLLTGSFDGQGGRDTLDYTAYTAALTMRLLDDTIDGFSGRLTLRDAPGTAIISGATGNFDVLLGGQTLLDELWGLDRDATWTLQLPLDSYRDDTTGVTLDYTFIEDLHGGSGRDTFEIKRDFTGNLFGGAGDDTFRFFLNFRLTGSVDGESGSDTLDYAPYLSPRTLDLTALGSTDGFDGVETGPIPGRPEIGTITGFFLNIETIAGSLLNGDSLQGLDSDSTWTVDGNASRYDTQGRFLSFEEMDTLIGEGGADLFRFADGATLAGSISGGAGADVLDYTNYTTARNVFLTGVDASGFSGAEASLGAGFSGMDLLRGGAATDQLTGPATDSIFFLTGANAGTVDGAYSGGVLTGGLPFTSFESLDGGLGTNTLDTRPYSGAISVNLQDHTISGFSGQWANFQALTGSAQTTLIGLVGGSLFEITGPDSGQVGGFTFAGVPNLLGYEGAHDDIFRFGASGAISGLLDGRGGADTLDFSATPARTITLTGAGSLDGFAGRADGLNAFDNINALIGSGADTLVAPNQDGVFVIDGVNDRYRNLAGTAVLALTGILNLTGGSAADTFEMHGTATWAGRFDGGAGNDTLDYSNYAAPISINLTFGSATGVFGGNAGGVTSIENVIGSPFGNVIYGDNSDNLLVGTNGADTIYGLGGNDILIGMGGNDRLDGGSGSDTADYRFDPAGVTASLLTNIATDGWGFTDAFVSIENLTGSDFDDVLTGNAAANVLTGGVGNDTLNGGAGDDTYRFGDNWGDDTLLDTGGLDMLDFSLALLPVALDLDTTGVIANGDLLNPSGAVFERVVGGAGADTFTFHPGFSLSGGLDGGAGADTLDLHHLASVSVQLSGDGATDGMNGSLAGVLPLPAGFTNLDALIGTPGSDTLTGPAAGTSYRITGPDSGDVNGRMTFAQFENLTGGAGNDTFAILAGGSLSGVLNAGAGADRLDVSGFAGAVVNLQNNTASGLANPFVSIESLTGDDLTTTLIAPNTGVTFSLTGANRGSVGAFAFTAVPNLTGGTGSDTFRFADGATLSGAVDGGAGVDLLDFSACLSGVTAALGGTATVGGVTFHVTGVENLTGGAGADVLTGDNGNNILTGNGGGDILTGGAGDDTYIFGDHWGAGDQIVELPGGGADTVDLRTVSAALTVLISDLALDLTDSLNTLQHLGGQIESLLLGSGNDAIRFIGTGSLNAVLDAGLGTNTLDYSAFTAPVSVNLGAGAATGLLGFSRIQALIGNDNTTLIGFATADTFNITGANSGTLVNGALTFPFSGVSFLDGAGGDDTFAVGASGSLTVGLDGGAGSDTLTFAGSAVARNITLTTANADGFSGLGGGVNTFSGIDALLGGSGADTLTGADQPATFEIDGTNRYLLGPLALSFSGFENLLGGSHDDLFQIAGAQTATLSGGGGDDTFAFASGAWLTGSLAGGPGSDLLTCGSACTVTLTTANLVDGGFDGLTSLASGGFTSLDRLTGSAASDTLAGTDAGGVFWLASGQYQSGGQTFAFAGVDVLAGGAGNDIFHLDGASTFHLRGGAGEDDFIFYNSTALIGSIDGGAGSHDRLNYSGVTIDVSVSFASGYATGVNSGAPGSISNLEDFWGGSGRNYIYGDNNDNTLWGGPSDDILVGLGGNDTYLFFDNWGNDTIIEQPGGGFDTLDFSRLTLPASGALTFVFDPSAATPVSITESGGNSVEADFNVENFISGPTDDTFIFNGSASFPGGVDGGAGSNTLDFSGYATWRDFALTDLGSQTGFNGTVANLGRGFRNITDLIGTAHPHGDSLTGMNATSHWHFNAASSLYENISAGRSLTFSGIESLVGGSGADNFIFADGAVTSAGLNGGGGLDWLDLSAYTTTVIVNLLTGQATLTGVIFPVSGIENVTGGQADDVLQGDGVANRLDGQGGNDWICGGAGDDFIIGGSGDDTLCGEAGNDTFWFADGFGRDTVLENDGEGTDTMDFTAVTTDLTVILGSIEATDTFGSRVYHADTFVEIVRGGSGNDTFVISGTHAVSLYGGAGDDRFEFADGARLNGVLDGGSGVDTLDYHLNTSPHDVTLTASLPNGFSGVQSDSLSSGFSGIDRLIGAGQGDALTGLNQTSEWLLDGSDRYLGGGGTLFFSGFGTLNGGSVADTFRLSGARTYSLLSGGAGDDTFFFNNGATLNGWLDGGSGFNTLDFSGYAVARDITLMEAGSHLGFNGREFAISNGDYANGGFRNINRIVGSQAADSLNGVNAPAVWNITGQNSGNYNALNRTIFFEQIETLSGQSGVDHYIFNPGADLSGSINGRGGTDILDLSRFTTGLRIDLLTGAIDTSLTPYYWQGLLVPVISGGVTSVEHVRTGSGDDLIYGDDRDNILEPGGGTNIICGRGGYDTGIVAAGSQTTNPCQDIENWTWLSLPAEPGEEEGQPGWLVVPVRSGLCTSPACAGHLGIILILPEGHHVILGCDYGRQGRLVALTHLDDLPVGVPSGYAPVFGMDISIWSNDGQLRMVRSPMLVSFRIPDWMRNMDVVILYLDPVTGKWIEKPTRISPDGLWASTVSQRTGIYLLTVRAVEQALDCAAGKEISFGDLLSVSVKCAPGLVARLAPLVAWFLPQELPDGYSYLSAMQVWTMQNDQPVAHPVDKVTFVVPPDFQNDRLVILYWENGGWRELPTTVSNGRAEAEGVLAGVYVLAVQPEAVSLACALGSIPLQAGNATLTAACESGAALVAKLELPKTLPGQMYLDDLFVSAVTVRQMGSAPVSLSFAVGGVPSDYRILRYDPQMDEGAGGWQEVAVGFSALVDQPGTYVLVTRR
jgi:Ca2+-binding RTX toxin-like protein